MKNVYLLVCFSCLILGTVGAQVPQSLDSVTIYLTNHTTQDTNYVRALNVMGREFHSTANPD